MNEIDKLIDDLGLTEKERVYIDAYSKGYNDGYSAARKIFRNKQQWVRCAERLPDQNGKYLVVGRQKAINILKFDGGRWYGKWGVVAWMPLPDVYKGEK